MHRALVLLRSAALRRPSLLHAAAAASSARSVVASTAFSAIAVRGFADAASSDRFVPKPVFSSFKIYKSKTALDVSVVRAQLGWNSPKVDERRYLSLKKAGGFRLTFAGGENKTYNWEEGQVITLSVTELGDVLAFAANKDQPEHKIFHDPLLGSQLAGQTRKELVLKRIGAGKPGYFFNFTVTSKDAPEGGAAAGSAAAAGSRKWSIAVTEGEFQVLLTLIQQTMPELLALSTKPTIVSEENSYAAQKAARIAGDDAANTANSAQQAPRKKWGDAK